MAVTMPSHSSVSVREVLQMIRHGRLRIPEFQRPFVWSAEQASSFLDSIVDGIPTGSILVFRKPADAEILRFGPVVIDAPARSDALWIVDGSQRLTVLAAVLLGHLLLGYDLKSGQIAEYEDLEPDLLPLGVLDDDDEFGEWQSGHSGWATEAEAIRSVVLDYQMPLTELPGDASAPEIFKRLNTGAVNLGPEDLRRASGIGEPFDLGSLLSRLGGLRFGRFSEELTRESVAAVAGPIPRTWRALQAAVTWLRDEASVPHLTVWRHQELLPVLARYFALNPRPSARARILLRRWLWRSMSIPTPELFADMITGRDSVDASRLVATAPASPPSPDAYLSAVGDELALMTLRPLSFVTDEPFAVADVLAHWGSAAFQPALGVPILAPPTGGALTEILPLAAGRPQTLASHALDRQSVDLFMAEREAELHERRRRLLSDAFQLGSAPLAAWGASDRPAISALLVSDNEDSDG
jgi:hypothetical protein